jgi:hypothetical protein
MEEKLRIYITGTSCAGVTTSSYTLATLLGVQHVDVDDFYWLPTPPSFTVKRPPSEHVCLIQQKPGDERYGQPPLCRDPTSTSEKALLEPATTA